MSEQSPAPSRVVTRGGYGGFVLIGWNAVLIPSLIRSVEHDFRQSDAAFGLLYLASSLVYSTGAWGGGLLTERWGRRVVLRAGTLALAVGLAGEALAPAWPWLLLAIVPVNWGAGVLDGGINALFLDLYRDARGGALNLLHLFFSLGALAAPFVVGQLIAAGLPWRAVPLGAAAIALPLAAFLSVAGMPSGRNDRAASHAAASETTPAEQSLWPFVGLALGLGLYVAGELAVSNWVVKLLANVPVATATAILSIFWLGIAVGRLASNWLAERIDYYAFTVACAGLATLALLGAVFSPSLPVAAVLFGLTGVFYGPIYPMIMALGGNIYPRRLAALGGGLAASAVVGSTIYPPLMGVFAASFGLRTGMAGAALLGIPTMLSVLGARLAARRAAAATAPPIARHAGR